MDLDKDLKGGRKKILLYHTDADGICSAALFLKFFDGFEPIPREGPIMDDKFLKVLTGKKPDLLAVLDIPIDQEWIKVKQLQNGSQKTKMLVIDHHVPEKNLSSSRNIHINPRFEKNVYVPASALVYRLLEKLGKDVKPFIWIATIGVIGDHAFEDCKDIFDDCSKAYPGICEEPRSSLLADLSARIMSAVVWDGVRGVEKSLEILMRADSAKDLKSNEYLSYCDKKVSSEIKRVMSDFKKRAKEHIDLDLIIYRLNSRLNIASTISSMLAEKHQDKIIMVTKHGKQYVKISARYQRGGISLNSLLKTIVAGIGYGGGHEKAAGAIVFRKDVKEFERRLIKRLRELKTK
jgi:single-stranded DNA-specific DHH superfamily exonuclease